MSGAIVEQRAATKNDQWRQRVAEQERGGLSIRQFCQERKLSEHSFYAWRRRLREEVPVRFALVERGPMVQEPAGETGLEVVLRTGERLRVGAGVDRATLRTVLETLRG